MEKPDFNYSEEPNNNKKRKDTVSDCFGPTMLSRGKQLGLFFVGFLGFQVIASIIQVILYVTSGHLGESIESALSGYRYTMITNSAAYIILIICLVAICYTDLPKLVKSFPKYQCYIAGFVCFIAIYAFEVIYGNLINLLIPVTENGNQASIESVTYTYRFTSLIIFGIIGPICEELTYRVGLFSVLRKKSRVLAYLVTIIIFAFIHFNFSSNPRTLLNEILNLPVYAFAAAAFSFVYDRYGLAASVTGHILNNLVSLFFVIF